MKNNFSNIRLNITRLGAAVTVFFACLFFSIYMLDIKEPEGRMSVWFFVPVIFGAAFLFQLMDTLTGMGLGTALSPFLFAMGYDPLSVVPTLLVSQAFTGILAGWMHNELGNAHFMPQFEDSLWRALLLVTVTGGITIIITVFAIYDAFELPDKLIESYVAGLVLLMGVFVFVKNCYSKKFEYRNPRLLGFALLAAFNKGIGGGGYGPILTLGALLSGYKEKETVALTVTGEGLVSLIGAITFFILMDRGLNIDYSLLPSVLSGGFLAAFLTPYLVKVCPSSLLRMIIPAYAVLIGLFLLVKLYLF